MVSRWCPGSAPVFCTTGRCSVQIRPNGTDFGPVFHRAVSCLCLAKLGRWRSSFRQTRTCSGPVLPNWSDSGPAWPTTDWCCLNWAGFAKLYQCRSLFVIAGAVSVQSLPILGQLQSCFTKRGPVSILCVCDKYGPVSVQFCQTWTGFGPDSGKLGPAPAQFGHTWACSGSGFAKSGSSVVKTDLVSVQCRQTWTGVGPSVAKLDSVGLRLSKLARCRCKVATADPVSVHSLPELDQFRSSVASIGPVSVQCCQTWTGVGPVFADLDRCRPSVAQTGPVSAQWFANLHQFRSSCAPGMTGQHWTIVWKDWIAFGAVLPTLAWFRPHCWQQFSVQLGQHWTGCGLDLPGLDRFRSSSRQNWTGSDPVLVTLGRFGCSFAKLGPVSVQCWQHWASCGRTLPNDASVFA